MNKKSQQRNKLIKERLELTLNVLENVDSLRYVGDDVLRQKTKDVELVEGLEIAKELERILLQYRKVTDVGRGIAAPQIGISESVFITYVDDTFEVFINPIITNRSESTNHYKELCMSSTVMSADVERSEWIVMEWTDKKGERVSKKVSGFLARLYQHEYAHLQGIINIDEELCHGIEFVTSDPLLETLRVEK